MHRKLETLLRNRKGFLFLWKGISLVFQRGQRTRWSDHESCCGLVDSYAQKMHINLHMHFLKQQKIENNPPYFQIISWSL